MTIRASASITLTCVVDVYSTTRYYLLQSSTLNPPARPTAKPPAGAWDDTEPGYVQGSTNTLYFTDLTVFSDGTWAYSAVSASSAYEAAKAAYNQAISAQSTAQEARQAVDDMDIGGRNLLLQSDGEKTATVSDSGSSAYTGSYYLSEYGAALAVEGAEFTFSMDYEVDTQTTVKGKIYTQLNGANTNAGNYMIPDVAAAPSGRASITFRVTAAQAAYADSFRMRLRIYNANGGASVRVWNLKLEKGNRPTDWTPAPEDVDAAIEGVGAAVVALDESLNQQAIFNRLTNNGVTQGIYLEDGKLYLNASYIGTGQLKVGGNTTGAGSIAIYAANGTLIGQIDANGLSLSNKSGVAQFVMDSTTGNATFAGQLSANCIKGGALILGGANADAAIAMMNASGESRGGWNKDAFAVWSGDQLKLWVDANGMALFSNGVAKLSVDNSGNATFAGTLNAATGLFKGEINVSNVFSVDRFGHLTTIDAMMMGSTNFVGDDYRCVVGPGGISFYTEDENRLHEVGCINQKLDGNLDFVCSDVLNIWADVDVFGNFSATGAKSRLVSTDQYSDRLLYCYETPTPMFGDIGEGVIGDDGLCYVTLDAVFAQTVTTDQYQVFLQKYGPGDCWVKERSGAYFIVEGAPGLKFGWEIKAKQRDYDQLRLERNDESFTPPTQTYGEDAAKHIDEIRKEREAA